MYIHILVLLRTNFFRLFDLTLCLIVYIYSLARLSFFLTVKSRCPVLTIVDHDPVARQYGSRVSPGGPIIFASLSLKTCHSVWDLSRMWWSRNDSGPRSRYNQQQNRRQNQDRSDSVAVVVMKLMLINLAVYNFIRPISHFHIINVN